MRRLYRWATNTSEYHFVVAPRNSANEGANAKIMDPIFTFFRTMERALDGANAHPGNPETDCAFQLFGEWAKAGALTSEPQVYEGQGQGKTRPAQQRVKKLAVAIGGTLCDSHKMETLAKAKIRIPDGQWAYEVTNGFGGDLLDANWSRCGLPQTDFNARDMGGDSRHSAAILNGWRH
jgi:hypothetical protein